MRLLVLIMMRLCVMARITVEDCLRHVENRFELVLLSSQRARQLELCTADPLVPVENDKPTVLSLREIAQGYITQQMIDSINNREVQRDEFIDNDDGEK